jgi:hypothetical protein
LLRLCAMIGAWELMCEWDSVRWRCGVVDVGVGWRRNK